MKYMCTWSIASENFEKVSKLYREGNEPTEGFKHFERWFPLGTGRGFVLLETDDPVAVRKLTRFWQTMMNIEVFPVLDDTENRKSISG